MTQAITIPVDAEIQQAFEQASEAERQELRVLVSLFFKEGWAKKNIVEVMQEIGNRAQERGLTPEILDEVLTSQAAEPKPRLMTKLRQVKISADPDLSTNPDRPF